MAKDTPAIIEDERIVPIGEHQIDITLTIPTGASKGKVLFLHGAGESDKYRSQPLARALAGLGWECLTFSFPGHGKSSGELLGSTLQARKELTRRLAESFGFLPADIVVGVSMGSHTAMSLLADEPKPYERAVLFVPAVYARAAEHAPFGPAFSAVLRTPESYRDSEIWDVLPSFRGRLVTVQTGQDEVIPPPIYDLIHKHARQADRQKVFVRESPHRISHWLRDDPARVADFAAAIDSFQFDSLRRYA